MFPSCISIPISPSAFLRNICVRNTSNMGLRTTSSMIGDANDSNHCGAKAGNPFSNRSRPGKPLCTTGHLFHNHSHKTTCSPPTAPPVLCAANPPCVVACVAVPRIFLVVPRTCVAVPRNHEARLCPCVAPPHTLFFTRCWHVTVGDGGRRYVSYRGVFGSPQMGHVVLDKHILFYLLSGVADSFQGHNYRHICRFK